jgi:uncharacterized MAPEG superfamily protein
MQGQGAPVTAFACMLYFWSRVAHAVIYTMGAPLLRTIAFLIGFGAQTTLLLRLFGAV